jgi:hypothetical protein
LKPSEARTFTVWVEAYGAGAVKGNGNGRLLDEPAHG